MDFARCKLKCILELRCKDFLFEMHCDNQKSGGKNHLTWAQRALVSSTGEVITLAEGAVDFAKLWLVAQALVTAAFSAAAAHLLALGLTAGTEVLVVDLSLLEFAAGSQVAGLTTAHPTAVGAGRVAAAAVGLCVIRAAAVTAVVHRDLQTVFKTNRPDGETLLGAFRRTSSSIYSYVEGDLQENTDKSFSCI